MCLNAFGANYAEKQMNLNAKSWRHQNLSDKRYNCSKLLINSVRCSNIYILSVYNTFGKVIILHPRGTITLATRAEYVELVLEYTIPTFLE